MAALVAGIQYGLSSQNSYYENKSLIFVKLTDSAQRTIEDYINNRNKINFGPTIQFLGNEGRLCFPSLKSSYGNFTFSLSNNQDIEGPQGGFECVQQTGPKNLESLGALPYKMRIQANDDVYETTRHRMHAAEENNKNKCTRVIKANEPVGRKVKVKGNVRAITSSNQLLLNSSTKSRESSNISNSVNQTLKSSTFCKLIHNNSSGIRIQNDNQKKLTDIMRKPLKERLIHLLALRPFKRPELYDRINREGVREKEKNVMANLLKQIAFMRDNTYHLNRLMWNEVHEDWPFYTEQEKAILKRRKPQNLTPPGSSDGGSSGSGQSPNSIHPGSPPAISAPPLDIVASKRPGYYQGNDGLPTKKQRISHYRKPESSSISCDNIKFNSNNSNTICDPKNQQNKQHEQKSASIVTKSNIPLCNDSDEINPANLISLHKQKPVNDKIINSKSSSDIFSGANQNDLNICQYQEYNQHNVCRKTVNNNELTYPVSKESHPINNYIDAQVRAKKTENNIKSQDLKIISEPNDSSNASEIAISYDFDSKTDKNSILTLSRSPTFSEISRDSENPEYLNNYTTIQNLEQRTRYKAEFNAYYKEYRKLHVQVVKISKQFSHLKDKLKEKLDDGNTEGSEAIKIQILQEYAKTKNINARFYYLHDKLGHIKKLVSDYDAYVSSNSSTNAENNHSNIHLNLKGGTFHHNIEEAQCTFTQLPIEQSLTCPSKISQIS